VYDATNPTGVEVLMGAAANGCDSTVTVNLSFAPPAMSTLSSTLCAGESVLVNGTVYNATNPTGTEVIENGSANGCDSIIQVSLSYLDQIVGYIEGGASICPGDSAELALRLDGATSFNVELSDGRTFSNVSDGTTFFVTPSVTTTYEITLLTAIGSLCPVEIGPGATVNVSALAAQAIVSTNYGGFGVSCAGSSDGAIQVQAGGAIPPLSYLWNTGATTAALANLSAGTYSVTITDGAGCTSESGAEIVEPEPIVIKATAQAPDCFNTDNGMILLESLSGGTPPFEYSLDGQFFQAAGSLPFTIPGLSAGAYELIVQDVNDCQVQATLAVPEAQVLVLELGSDKTIKLGDSIRLVPQVNFTIDTFTWSPSNGLSAIDVLDPFAGPQETTAYTLRASDAAGCSVTDQITIFVDNRREVYAPNVFSPNNDGRNDYFTLFAGPEVEQIRIFRIFDRWGGLLFETGPIQPNDETLGWDGTFNGQEMDPAVFVFYAEVEFIDGKVELVKGDVTLLR
ncbi:MAG: T9SS type B sorting domain-containing protein, partial [Phaeodactylibacter sp.]|nr:T9SS type B sorting domain-containing protein [Phaeodactylibacter sp.]